jgi:hypothetical protein
VARHARVFSLEEFIRTVALRTAPAASVTPQMIRAITRVLEKDPHFIARLARYRKRLH